jgi:hypothetical protein
LSISPGAIAENESLGSSRRCATLDIGLRIRELQAWTESRRIADSIAGRDLAIAREVVEKLRRSGSDAE